jgi:hypothetical protein
MHVDGRVFIFARTGGGLDRCFDYSVVAAQA